MNTIETKRGIKIKEYKLSWKRVLFMWFGCMGWMTIFSSIMANELDYQTYFILASTLMSSLFVFLFAICGGLDKEIEE